MTNRLKFMMLFSIPAVLSVTIIGSPATAPAPAQDEILRLATSVFDLTANAPIAGLPDAVLEGARGIAVFPGARRETHVFAGAGVASVRELNGTFGPPAMLTFRGHIPYNLESSTVDFIVIARTPAAARHLMGHDTRTGHTVSILAGGLSPEGSLDADLLAYVRFGDYLLGVPIAEWKILRVPSAARSERLLLAERLWLNALGTYFDGMDES